MKSNGKGKIELNTHGINMILPSWFSDKGTLDLVERLLIHAAFLDCHVGTLRRILSNKPVDVEQDSWDEFSKMVLQDLIALAEISLGCSVLAESMFERDKTIKADPNVVNALQVFADAVEWLEQLVDSLE